MPVKTDEKKQHFDDIYVADTPVPYKTEILDKLEYISDTFNQRFFDRHILPWAQSQKERKLNFVDLCACFGNTTMATVYGMSYEAIRENWKDAESCQTIAAQRRFDCHTTAIDISAPAMAYGAKVGLYDTTIVKDLNDSSDEAIHAQVQQTMADADVFICTAALVYLDLETIETLISTFGKQEKEGYVMVNFLNPFSLEKADATKQLLLKYLDFVGSMATRHRRMSPLEQENYPGEEWALLELWVLKRKS
mmetsp:Transcript_24114/g.67940  ORF Transcript_24114/g.67940 Transcript_24114/m.67940 type:complete len:250 (+) Transcript_24114:108-857(+)|eukprot:CAMPEP_0119566242 /NCGR_PEP_ID=MMETSP1352-20130426/32525_1 /TAXON_ID=265584 /ORGANISM="Stauroneis constricta, Strain CCMP1120" /LENGTH=249 /DNA_ID=CAMNT_0007615311 /DNA_START=58 /DNA_END=807 /DNA_ORIENTATION=+